MFLIGKRANKHYIITNISQRWSLPCLKTWKVPNEDFDWRLEKGKKYTDWYLVFLHNDKWLLKFRLFVWILTYLRSFVYSLECFGWFKGQTNTLRQSKCNWELSFFCICIMLKSKFTNYLIIYYYYSMPPIRHLRQYINGSS